MPKATRDHRLAVARAWESDEQLRPSLKRWVAGESDNTPFCTERLERLAQLLADTGSYPSQSAPVADERQGGDGREVWVIELNGKPLESGMSTDKALVDSDVEPDDGEEVVRYVPAISQPAPSVARWVPVSERLPKLYTECLVATVTGHVRLVELVGAGHWRSPQNGAEWSRANVTHWAPLPAPPGGGK